MSIEIFVDTSGWMATFNVDDAIYPQAKKWFQQVESFAPTLITTDYIIDETVSLFRHRRSSHLIKPFLERVFSSWTIKLEWVDKNRFFQARDFLLKHEDKAYSFTDCTSFVVMKELRLTDALASDRHFKQAGFKPILC